jgi:hypothetical protein
MNAALRSAVAGAAVLAFALIAQAQESAPEPPTGEARIEVTLVHDGGAEAVAGVEVILYSLSPSGDPGLRRERTDAEGRAAFDGLSNDPDVVYLVGTRIAGVPFGTRFAFERDEQSRAVEIQVSDPNADASAVAPGETRLRLEPGCSDLRVHHTHALHNRSERVVYVAPALRGEAIPLLELDLPESASPIETPLGAGGDSFERNGRNLRFWGPLYPGVQEIEFGYGVPLLPSTELEMRFLQGTERVSVFTPSGGIEIIGETLRSDGELPLPSGPHRVQRSGALAPGASLALAVSADASVAPADLQLAESRLWLELDDAALDVNEQHQVSNDGPEAIQSSTGSPLLCLPLPPEAADVRFGTPSPDLAITRDPSGALAVYGPLPPGESTLSLRYRMPASDQPFAFQRTFATEVQLLTVLVADTGIALHSERLHPRRPVRTEDRAYLHLEGFAIGAEEVVELDLERLPRSGGVPRIASIGFVVAVAFASVFFLAAPLRGSAASEAPAVREPAQAIERQALYHAIEALDEDFETGKISQADHAQMREEMRARAVLLLQSERAETAPPADPVTPAQARQDAPAPVCAACGAPSQSGDRFCAQCGAPLSCPGCDAPLRAGDRFCSRCGHALAASEPPSA